MKEKISASQKALNVWAIVLIMWSIYRANFGVSVQIEIDEFIIKPLFFILPVLWYTVKIEKKNFLHRINLHFKTLWLDMGIGIFCGSVFILMGIVSYWMKHGFVLPEGGKTFLQASTLLLFTVSLATSIIEEILSRGFVLTHLYEESKNKINSIFISSVLFFFLHIPILFTQEHLSGQVLLQVMTMDIALSITVSVLFFLRKNLLLPIIVHAFYSFAFNFFI